MKVAQEHIEFVARLIESGDDAGNEHVYVDVLQIGERFEVTWPAAMKIMRRAAKDLGHAVISRNKVSRAPMAPPKPEKTPVSHQAKILDAIATLMEDYENNPRQV